MMKIHAIILILFIFSTALHSQIPNGLYKDTTYHRNSNDSILFSDNHASFYILTNYSARGISKMIKGEGPYKIVKNFLIISTEKYTGIHSYVDKIESKSFEIKLVFDDNRIGKNGVMFIDKDKKIIGGGKIDTTSFIQMDVPEGTKYIESWFGPYYDPLHIEYEEGYKYSVFLSKGSVIENEDVIFKITKKNKKLIKLIYSEYKCESGNFNKEDIREINKRIDRFGFRKRKYYLVNQ